MQTASETIKLTGQEVARELEAIEYEFEQKRLNYDDCMIKHCIWLDGKRTAYKRVLELLGGIDL